MAHWMLVFAVVTAYGSSNLFSNFYQSAFDGLEAALPVATEVVGKKLQRHLLESQLSGASLDTPTWKEMLWQARISLLAYSMDKLQLSKDLDKHGCKLRRFVRQTPGVVRPQWFLCAAARHAHGDEDLFVVFRGTHSVSDALTDIRVEPMDVGAASIHGGFLDAFIVAWEDGLGAELCSGIISKARSVNFLGHSLGGALAVTALLADVLPLAKPGKYFATSFGAPAVLHGPQPLAAARRHGTVRQFIFENDPVPRLLGNDLKGLRAVLALLPGERAAKRIGFDANVVGQYEHLHAAEIIWLRGGRGLLVPGDRCSDFFHLHDAVAGGANTRFQHAMDRYISSIALLAEPRHRSISSGGQDL